MCYPAHDWTDPATLHPQGEFAGSVLSLDCS